jgi:hypothetical protein
MKSSVNEGNARRTTMDYLAVGLPMGKFGAGFGLVPYSSVGYKIETKTDGVAQNSNKYTGSGGVNKAFVGLGYAISSKFNIGLDLSYNFGKMKTSSLVVKEIESSSREINESDMSGASFTVGLTYRSKINNKLSFFSSLTFSPESNLKLANDRKIAIVQLLTNGAEIETDYNDIEVNDKTIKLPSKFSFGAGIGEFKKWMVGTEITFQQSNTMENRFDDITKGTFENAAKYAIGGYFIPNYNSFSNYWNKVTYRGGLRYENTGLILNNRSINDMGMTLGLGLPLSGTFSNINVGFEYGKRGTPTDGLVRENYANFTIGLSFNDKWFVRRLYN